MVEEQEQADDAQLGQELKVRVVHHQRSRDDLADGCEVQVVVAYEGSTTW